MPRLLILLSLLLVACDQAGVARVRFVLPEELPARTLYGRVRVEEQSDRVTQLGGAEPVELRPEDDQLLFDKLSIPHGEDRVVIAELSESPDRDIVWYGFSRKFSFHPGDDLRLFVALDQQPPLDNRVRVLTDTPGFVRTSTVILEITSDRGVRALLSNSQNFPNAEPIELEQNRAMVSWTLDEEFCEHDDNCNRTVFARFIDENGYESRTATAGIVLDTAPPQLFGEVGIRLIPDATNPLDRVTSVREGTRVQVTLPLSEALSEPPRLVAVSAYGSLDFDRCEGSGLSWLCNLTFPPPTPELVDARYWITASAIDRAGNRAPDLQLGTFFVDVGDPGPPNTLQENCISYERIPFGPNRSFKVRSCAWAVPPGDTMVILDRREVATAIEIGRSEPADAEGNIEEIELSGAIDRPRIYAATIDSAGNRSDGALIRSVIATATFGDEPDNPSRVLLDPNFETFARDRREGAYREATGVAPYTSNGGYTWREVTLGSPGPSARENRAVVWDPVRDRAVVFGGISANGQLLQDHWEWDGFNWEEIDVGTDRPEARDSHAMVADVARSQVVLFGGRGTDGVLLPNTWTFKDGIWEEHEHTEPRPRLGHSMVYDPIRGQTILIGGWEASAPPRFLNDIWMWDGTWTRLTPLSPPGDSPTPGFNRSAAFDYERGVIVLFGGGRGNTDEDADVWEWDGDPDTLAWTHRPPTSSSPLPRRKAMLVFHPAFDRMLMFGGSHVDGLTEVILGDAHLWDGNSWEALEEPLELPARTDGTMFLDRNRGHVYTFGGDPPQQEYADLLLIHADRVESLDRTVDPAARTHAAIAADPITGAPLLFGGDPGLPDVDDWQNDLWRFDRSTWIPVDAAGPPPLAWPRMATDPVSQRAVLTGVATSSSVSETWIFDGTAWSELPDPRPPLDQTALAYSPADHRVISFGGWSAIGAFTEQWSLPSEGGWSPTSSGLLTARHYHAMTADPLGARLLLFGGGNETISHLSDLWSWNGAWTLLQPSLRARSDHAMVFDPTRDRLLVFGGNDPTSLLAHLESWDASNESWREEELPSTEHAPMARAGHAMQRDARFDRTLLFAGCAEVRCVPSVLSNDDTWLLERGANTHPAVVLIADLGAAESPRKSIRSVTLDVSPASSELPLVWHAGSGRWVSAAPISVGNAWIDGALHVHAAVVGAGDVAGLERAEVIIEYWLDD